MSADEVESEASNDGHVLAYAITKAILSAADPTSEIYPAAAGTPAGNAAYNRIMPFHPGAMRFHAEAGIKLPSS